MLFPINQVDTRLSYLNNVLLHFLRKSVRLKVYRKASLFPRDFLVVHDSNRNAVEKKFKAVFLEIKELEDSDKAKLLRLYRNQQRIQGLCSDKSITIQPMTGLPETLIDALKELGKYLYENALKLESFTSLPAVNDTLVKHFQRFVDANGNVCCFCGINDYEEQLANVLPGAQWRAAYDHYLPKKKYPLATVNFNNLVPICYQCNSKAKLSKDPCVCKNAGRRFAYYPYEGSESAKLQYSYKTSARKILEGNVWKISTKDTGLNIKQKEKQSNWDRVFKITSRLEQRVNRLYKRWIETEIDKSAGNVTAIKQQFEDVAVEHLAQKRDVEDAYHKALLFANLATLSDELIESICDAVGKISAPANKQEALDELNNLGFDF